jgi:hypothetical protein
MWIIMILNMRSRSSPQMKKCLKAVMKRLVKVVKLYLVKKP